MAAIISALVHDRQFEAAVQKKTGTAVNTDDLEKELDTVKGQLRQLLSTKTGWKTRWMPWMYLTRITRERSSICSISVGNPARVLRKRFDDELIDLLLRFRWWEKSIEEINGLIPILTCSDLE